MSRYDLLCCDADETLLDFKKAEETAFFEACGALGIPAGAEDCRRYSEINLACWKLFEQGKSKKYSVTFLMEGVENNYYSVDDVDVDSIGKTIRINAKGVQMSRVTGLRIRDGMEFYKVDFKNNTIEAAIVSVEGNGMYTITLSTYTQEYTPKTRNWSEPEGEQSTSTLWT